MRGYKAFLSDMTTRHGDNTVYEVGKIYTVEGEVKICENGYHFCKKCVDVYDYYSKPCRICEVSVTGAVQTQGNKSVGRKLKILRELTADEISSVKSLCIICSVILGLCDTSNMIELPLDKDGEVIRGGDTVYVDDDVKYEVVGYMIHSNGTEVILAAGAEPVYTKEPANDITHKKPVTIASLVERMRDVLDDDDDMTAWVFSELSHIADQLEKLGDSNA